VDCYLEECGEQHIGTTGRMVERQIGPDETRRRHAVSAVRNHDAATRPIEAIAHPARLAILQIVLEAGRPGIPSGLIARHAGLSAPATSHHLSWLTEAGLLISQRSGRSVIYRAAGEVLGGLIRALEIRLGGVDEMSPFAWRPRTTAGPRTAWLRVAEASDAPTRFVWPGLQDGFGHWEAAAAPPYQKEDRCAIAKGGGSKPASGQPFNAIVYHGGRHARFRPERFNIDRGIYFATDREYAGEWGGHVHRCRVKLTNPVVYDEAAANSTIEIDRLILMAKGYDGRIIVYNDGELDVIAFDPQQIEILDPSAK
jgi:ArsR family transcriptional regulator